MASSGAEAVEKAEQLRPDAITLDVFLAGGNGFETLAVLRQTPGLKNTPVIIVSIVDQQRLGLALEQPTTSSNPFARPCFSKPIPPHLVSHRQPQMIASRRLLVVDDEPERSSTSELSDTRQVLRQGALEKQGLANGFDEVVGCSQSQP